MKKMIVCLTAAAVLGLGALISRVTVKADEDQPRRRSAAIFVGYDGEYIRVKGEDGFFLRQVGMTVTWTSASPNCPQIPEGTSLGVATAFLMAEGFTLEPDSRFGVRAFIRRR